MKRVGKAVKNTTINDAEDDKALEEELNQVIKGTGAVAIAEERDDNGLGDFIPTPIPDLSDATGFRWTCLAGE